MYTITPELQKEVESWIKKLPDSINKSQIINLFENVFPTHRMTTEQLEQFLSYQHGLPKEFETYPQAFAQDIKNPHEDTKDVLSDSHKHIKAEKVSGDKGKQKQEILHTLNVTDKKEAGTKADPDHELKSKTEKPEKMKGNKTESQAKEEEAILARNKDTSSTKKTEKPKVVVVNKTSSTKHKK